MIDLSSRTLLSSVLVLESQWARDPATGERSTIQLEVQASVTVIAILS